MSPMQKLIMILSLLMSFSTEFLERFIMILTEGDLDFSSTILEFAEKERFSEGVECPYCEGIYIVRNGHRKTDNAQRYLCRECGKSFVATTYSVASGTRKSLGTWKKFFECMVNGFSVRKTAEICGIHKNTAFIWRHKVLDALSAIQEEVEMQGIVEADETFFPLSYKGNHSKSSFVMPREAHERGHSVKKQGLSDEQVCTVCAVNRKGLAVSKVGKLGKVSSDCLEAVLSEHILWDTVICTDKEKAYRRFSEYNNYNLIQLENGKASKGIYNIQHINSYHSQLKNFMYRFKGVSTKYLNNYLAWHNFVNYSKETYKEKLRVFGENIMSVYIKENSRDISKRDPVPLLV